MGNMTTWMSGGLAKGGTNATNADSSAVLQAVADQVDPNSAIAWQSKSPTVMRQMKGASLKEADAAERAAALYEQAVTNGKRRLEADERRQKAHVDLLISHRRYLSNVAGAHLEAATANKNLASRLQGLRGAYAELGMGLERKVDQVNQRIDVTASKYGRITA